MPPFLDNQHLHYRITENNVCEGFQKLTFGDRNPALHVKSTNGIKTLLCIGFLFVFLWKMRKNTSQKNRLAFIPQNIYNESSNKKRGAGMIR